MSKSFSNARTRRNVLQSGLAFGTAIFTTPGLFAELVETARVGEGPFYPDKMPLDTDNDLIVINDSITPAVGEITHLSGRVTDMKGAPLRNAFIEIWQVDNNAVYLHTGDTTNRDNQDTNFQGYGRFLTDAQGQYYFRTIKPVAYPGRTPHIHVAVSRNGHRILTTQLFVEGEEGNARDGLFRRLQVDDRASVTRKFDAIPDSTIGELAVNFDIVVGKTAFEGDDGTLRGGIGASEWQRRRR